LICQESTSQEDTACCWTEETWGFIFLVESSTGGGHLEINAAEVSIQFGEKRIPSKEKKVLTRLLQDVTVRVKDKVRASDLFGKGGVFQGKLGTIMLIGKTY